MTKTKVILALLLLCFFSATAQYNVKTFGATGNGATLDTRAIQSAIDKAWKAKGGTVLVPAGTYRIGTLILKDNVELHLQKGATLIGSPNYRDYIAVEQKLPSRTRDLYAKYFMVFAEGAQNISITGAGTIHGNGLDHFQEVKPQNLRPYMIRLVSCSNVSITGVKLLEAANWTLHLLGCTDVNVDNIVIENKGEGNRDGLDIDACQRVTVANSRFSTTDDAIVMKATNDTLCQDIAIANCTFREIGGSAIKTGTESNGGFKNITVTNCVIRDIDLHAGIELMTVDGGMMQNIIISNITMDNVATPIFIRLGLRVRPYMPMQYVQKVDDVKNIQLSHIIAVNAKYPSGIIGLHSKKISNVLVRDYTVHYAAKQEPRAFNAVPFLEFDYPAAIMFSELPAYGIYCRSVDELTLENITLQSADGDKRPAIAIDRGSQIYLSQVKAVNGSPAAPLVYIRESQSVKIAGSRLSGTGNALLVAEENIISGLRLLNNTVNTGQQEFTTVKALPDPAPFEDIETSMKYIVTGNSVQGMPARDLYTAPLRVQMRVDKKGSLQLCMLTAAESKEPQKLQIKYEGITQEFWVSWQQWGWAPVTLLKQFEPGSMLDVEISSPGSRTPLHVSRVYIRYQDIGFTD